MALIQPRPLTANGRLQGAQGVALGELQAVGNSPCLTAVTNAANASAPKTRAGPSGSLLSRMGTAPGMNPGAASMHSPPLAPL